MAKRKSVTEGKTKQSDHDQSSGSSHAHKGSVDEEGNGMLDTPAPEPGTKQEQHAMSGPEFNARVARKAYELFEGRGGETGRDVEDWLEAERRVKEEILRESQS
jgi:Protein of unknown function (DUF2934)